MVSYWRSRTAPDLMAESATSAPASLTQEDATIGAFEPVHREVPTPSRGFCAMGHGSLMRACPVSALWLEQRIRRGSHAFDDDAMGCAVISGTARLPEEVERLSNSQPEEHPMSACGGSGPTIAAPPRLDRVVLIPCSAGSARQWKA